MMLSATYLLTSSYLFILLLSRLIESLPLLVVSSDFDYVIPFTIYTLRIRTHDYITTSLLRSYNITTRP